MKTSNKAATQPAKTNAAPVFDVHDIFAHAIVETVVNGCHHFESIAAYGIASEMRTRIERDVTDSIDSFRVITPGFGWEWRRDLFT